MNLKQIGEIVFAARVEKKLTQAELAARANVSRRLVVRLENGQVNDIGHARLSAIAQALDLELVVQKESRLRDAWL